jgi:hypothetical protein
MGMGYATGPLPLVLTDITGHIGWENGGCCGQTLDTQEFVLIQKSSVTKIGCKLQKLNIYGIQQGTLFLTTKETQKS